MISISADMMYDMVSFMTHFLNAVPLKIFKFQMEKT